MKVVYNKGHNIFTLSDKALELLNHKRIAAGLPPIEDVRILERHDTLLVNVIEILGSSVNKGRCDIRIKEIPDEYLRSYEIQRDEHREKIICDSTKLFFSNVSRLNVNNMSESQCKTILSRVVEILNSGKYEISPIPNPVFD